MWQALRNRPGGMRFRHQHPARPYILDFFCPRRRLTIEVDGAAHACGDRPERDAWLRAHRVHVLRIPASEVLSDLEGMMRTSSISLVATTPPPASPVLSDRMSMPRMSKDRPEDDPTCHSLRRRIEGLPGACLTA
nr:endonuclease domain-containing protein [Sphingomonas xinjiangensis]